jgi:hypothetical protein
VNALLEEADELLGNEQYEEGKAQHRDMCTRFLPAADALWGAPPGLSLLRDACKLAPTNVQVSAAHVRNSARAQQAACYVHSRATTPV